MSPTWVDWTVLPMINVVNDALFTGDLLPAKAYFSDLTKYHVYRDWINATGKAAGLVVDNRAQCARDPNQCLGALVDTSGGSDDGFVQSSINSVANAWVFYGTQELAKLARWLGKDNEAAILEARAAALKAAFNRLCIGGADGAVCDGVCAETSHTSVHSSFYALAFGLVDDTKAPGVWSYIMQRVTSSTLGVPCGAYPVQFLLIALYQLECDHGNAAFGVLTSTKAHSWLAMLDVHNATTTMECWDPEELPNLTFSHIWSASPTFIIPWLLVGIRPLLPGWAKFAIKPQAARLTSLVYTQPTIRGPITANVTQTFATRQRGVPSTVGASRAHGTALSAASLGNVSTGGQTAVLTGFTMVVSIPGNTIGRLHIPIPAHAHAHAALPADFHGAASAEAPLRLPGCVKLNGREVGGHVTEQGAHAWVEVGSGVHTVAMCD